MYITEMFSGSKTSVFFKFARFPALGHSKLVFPLHMLALFGRDLLEGNANSDDELEYFQVAMLPGLK